MTEGAEEEPDIFFWENEPGQLVENTQNRRWPPIAAEQSNGGAGKGASAEADHNAANG